MNTNRRRSGMTLVELLIGIFLLVMILVLIYQMMFRSQEVYESAQMFSSLQERVAESTRWFSDDTRMALPTQLIVYADYTNTGANLGSGVLGHSLRFYQLAGWSAGVPTLSTYQVRFRAVPNDGEPDDGIDNNGDGLIDERKFVRERWTDVNSDGLWMDGTEAEDGIDNDGDGLIDEKQAGEIEDEVLSYTLLEDASTGLAMLDITRTTTSQYDVVELKFTLGGVPKHNVTDSTGRKVEVSVKGYAQVLVRNRGT